MNKVLIALLSPVISKIIDDILSKENYQYYGDKLLDLIEEAIADSQTTLDDRLLLPVVQKFRQLADIPDLPDAP